MNLSQREKTLILITAFALAIFGFTRFLYLPGQDMIIHLQAANQQLEEEQLRLEGIILLKQEKAQTISESTDLDMMREQLPTQEEMIPILKFLDESTMKYDVVLSYLEYQGSKEEEEGDTRTLTFVVDTRGSIFNLIGFLQELLIAPRVISVAEVSLNACQTEERSVADEEERTPTYYVSPPGVPQAKLEQVKMPVEDDQLAGDQPEQLVADSFIPNKFDMKVTINAYYAPEQPINEKNSRGDQIDEVENAAENDSKGRI